MTLLKSVIIALGMAAALAGCTACEVARYHECRRYHPAWYCLDQSGQ